MIDLNTLTPRPSAEIVMEGGAKLGAPGVYFVFFDAKEMILERSGYYEFDRAKPLVNDGHELLYTGASLDPLRRRVLDHLTGNTKGSSLRMTAGVLMTTELGLDPVAAPNRTYFDFGDGEQRLTDWLLAKTRVATVADDDPYYLEHKVLTSTPMPLNISERRRHPYSKYLMNLRSLFAARPRAAAPYRSLLAAEIASPVQ